MGVHDREEDRVFRFLNGTIYDPSNKDEDHLYHWDEGLYILFLNLNELKKTISVEPNLKLYFITKFYDRKVFV